MVSSQNAQASGNLETPGKLITIPQSSMKRIKSEERERGARQALLEQAKSMGFDSWVEAKGALDAAKALKTSPRVSERGNRPQASAPKPGAKDESGVLRMMRRDNERLLENQKRLNRARSSEEKRRRQIEREKDALEAEHALRLAAVRAGVQDTEYALHLLRKEMVGKNQEQLRGFDEEKFFSEHLRQKHPYLYSTQDRIANTGAPPAQRPSTSTAPSSTTLPAIDGLKLSREDLEKRLKAHGLAMPGFGTPS